LIIGLSALDVEHYFERKDAIRCYSTSFWNTKKFANDVLAMSSWSYGKGFETCRISTNSGRAALILPACNTEAMNLHLAEIANAVAPGAKAVLVFVQVVDLAASPSEIKAVR